MTPETFVNRRTNQPATTNTERRQFGNTYSELSPSARELGEAIDRYKLMNRRRYISYEEMLSVMMELGYAKGQS